MKLIILVMGADHAQCLDLCLESVKGHCDALYYLDGGSSDDSIEVAEGHKATVLKHKYDHDDKAGNGKQRNFYLNFLKKHHLGDWCLVLDADELVENPECIRKSCELIEVKAKEGKAENWICDVKMRHFIGNFAFEDASLPEHWCQGRLFKVSNNIAYPEIEHPVLGCNGFIWRGKNRGFTIWHLAYVLGVFAINERYDNHVRKSDMHTPLYLTQWNSAHLLGTYPTKRVPIEELPSLLKKRFCINDSYEYYKTRMTPEAKHFLMVQNWAEHCGLEEYADAPNYRVLDVGCGAGHFANAWQLAGYDVMGIDIDEWIVKNTPYNFDKRPNIHSDALMQGDITDPALRDWLGTEFDIITAIDVLEHVTEQDLPIALKNLYELGVSHAQYIFSVPFLGDPNLMNDSTHKIFKEKAWWVEQLSKVGFSVEDAPKNWLYHAQILTGTKK